LILIEFFLFNLFFLQNFNGDEFLKCLMELVNIEKEWVPKEESCSLYVRPTIIGTGVS
jgi:branched-chain amino acid aminotransferase